MSEYVSLKREPLKQMVATAARVLHIREKFVIYASTQHILDQLRAGQGRISEPRRSGKTSAILLRAKELMNDKTRCGQRVVVLFSTRNSLRYAKTLWERMFPFEKSPLLTTDASALRGACDVLVDESEKLRPDVKEEVNNLYYYEGLPNVQMVSSSRIFSI